VQTGVELQVQLKSTSNQTISASHLLTQIDSFVTQFFIINDV